MLKKIICIKCGQQIFPITDSWTGHGAEKQHVTCPISQALQDVPTISTDLVLAEPRQPSEQDVPTVKPDDHSQPSAEMPTGRPMTIQKPSIPDFLTLDEVAEKLRLSKSSVRRYIRQGDLKAKRLPGQSGTGKLLFDALDVLALLSDA
jgi:excisionase family DNA binding protein